MGLRDFGNELPPGFRFYPSDEELVCHYLYKKIANEEIQRGTLVEIDLHTCEPWQLPDVAKLNSSEWYFFSFRDRKYATGFRTNRATTSGYWKATGKDRVVVDPRSKAVVGMRKTLVFYKNRAPNGIKSGWIMHEFRLENPHVPPKEDWVLCRVFHKSRCDQNSNKCIPQETNTTHNHPSLACTTSHNLVAPHTSEHAYIPSTNLNNITNTYSHHQNPSNTSLILNQNPNTSLGLSPFDPNNRLDLSHRDISDHEPNHLPISNYSDTKITDHASNCEDDYGFLFDMSLDESNAIPTSLGDMRFDDDDNGSVFI